MGVESPLITTTETYNRFRVIASVTVVCSLVFLFVSHNRRFSSLVSNSALYFLFYWLYFVKHFSVFGSG